MMNKFRLLNFNMFCMLVPVGRLEDQDAVALRKEIANQIAQGNSDIIIDFNEVSSITTQVLGTLVWAWRTIGNAQGSFHLICNRDAIKFTFEYTNLETIVKVFRSKTQLQKELGLADLHDAGKYKVVDVREPFGVLVDAQYLDRLFAKLVRESKTYLAVDMKEVTHIYSSVLGVFIRWVKELGELSGELCLFNLSDDLLTVLQYVGLDKELRILQTERELLD